MYSKKLEKFHGNISGAKNYGDYMEGILIGAFDALLDKYMRAEKHMHDVDT